MKIVRFKGGLGNQLFQYGLFVSLIENFGEDVYIDLGFYDHFKDYNRVFYIEKAFNLEIRQFHGSPENIKALANNNHFFLARLKLKILGYKKTHYVDFENGYDKNVFRGLDLYLDGYWQSYKYFINYENKLLSKLIFKINIEHENTISLAQRIKLNSNSVSIHVRLGDYLNSNVYTNLLNTNYYTDSLKQTSPLDRKVYVFSDDIKYLSKMDQFSDFELVDTSGLPDHYDMYLMSLCKTNIIANSTYSWWGAFLNRNLDKEVYCPSRWFAKRENYLDDLYPSDWNIIDVKF
jgi:hypothetical protein